MGLRERKKEQTRELIAETARGLFGERGFEAVTVAEIARAADVSTQTVFNYFPTKEDLVYWRLESFEEELLSTIRDRAAGESVLTAFGRFVRAPRGMLGSPDPETRERLAGVTRMIVQSPSLLAREQQIFAGYTADLAELLGADITAQVAANAMMGVHRALVDYTRRRIVEGARAELAGEIRAQADAALALLGRGLGDYGVR
ncbi:TetR/AcrR family transcriptional regulator [Solirubrobacter ginsenosidimutans]|uniref:TetR/AcrR family transcriptional regulator n=1 Tax=Solirubrobacter ginsenosidimutans TaxID=490573 RepID=A0A9X3S2T0_9ACTN|nr:TetR family transcriptional regulator [Solirubrobacter ginsenosidimutans]MDA0161431.1 TetR/AcrR family transcriptional regulator [Solirubrobacter ginsenosidimutans]